MTEAKTEKFEVCLKKIEKIVEKLEEGEISLDDSLKAFEEGMKLVKQCENSLEVAQSRIEILVKDRDGRKSPRNFIPEE